VELDGGWHTRILARGRRQLKAQLAERGSAKFDETLQFGVYSGEGGIR
jgi:hypothetical protein